MLNQQLKVILTKWDNPTMIYDHLQAKRLLWYQNDGGMNQ